MSQYPGGHPPPPYAMGPQIRPKSMNWLGSTALALAIVGLVLCWSVVGGVLFGVTAVILGFSAHGRVTRGQADNDAVATGGIALGALAVIMSLAVIAIWVRVYHDVDVPAYADCVSSAPERQGVDRCGDELRQRVEDELGITVEPNP
jgi:hypothetical protein